MKRWILATVALLSFCSVPLGADEPPLDKLTLEIPAAVKATIAKEVGDGKVSAFYGDVDEDKEKIFVAKAIINGCNYTIKVTPEGKLLSDDIDAPDPDRKPIGEADLPPAVKASLQKAAGGAPVSSVIREEQRTIYEMEVKIGASTYIIRIDSGGQLQSMELDEEDEPTTKSAV